MSRRCSGLRCRGEGLVAPPPTAKPEQLVDLGGAAARARGGDQLDGVYGAGADLDLLG